MKLLQWHAYIKDLQQLVAELKPKCIIPIHTFHREKYQELFKDTGILSVKDRQELNVV